MAGTTMREAMLNSPTRTARDQATAIGCETGVHTNRNLA